MKILFSFFLYVCTGLQLLMAQRIPQFGDLDRESLKMVVYEPDTLVSAVVLAKTRHTTYEYNTGGFTVKNEFFYRIKILKPEGKKYGDVAIVFYNGRNSSIREWVSKINAVSYNLEGGKVVEQELEKKYIFREKLEEGLERIKFSIPNVKEGTVVEYKYTCESANIFQLDDWSIQEDIPVVFAQCTQKIPEYFIYTEEVRGYEPLDRKEEPYNGSLYLHTTQGTENLTYSGKKTVYTSNNVPALKDEPMVWHKEDFASSVLFELQKIELPYSLSEPVTTTWDEVMKLLKSHERFGGYLGMRNPLRDEMKAADIKAIPDVEGQLSATFALLKQKVRWNGEYRLLGDSPSDCVKTGMGNNANINFILMSMLDDLGIQAFPVLLRPRSMGRLPLTHPSIEAVYTFIVAATDGEKVYYMDGSADYGDVNVLPSNLMVDRAVLYTTPVQMADLSSVSTGEEVTFITASLAADGKIEGKVRKNYKGVRAESMKRKVAEENDSTLRIRALEEMDDMQIVSYEWKGGRGIGRECSEIFSFEGEVGTDDYLYITPLLFTDADENPFTDSVRKLPVEWAYPMNVQTIVTLKIPEGYEVAELPQGLKISTEGGTMSFFYYMSVINGMIQIRMTQSVSQLIFPVTEYSQIRSFWETIANKCREQVVLKRKEAGV